MNCGYKCHGSVGAHLREEGGSITYCERGYANGGKLWAMLVELVGDGGAWHQIDGLLIFKY
jgi:hypothetical protein